MITWVLLLWVGFPLPMKIDGYPTYDECKNAGEYWSANHDGHVAKGFSCIPGPSKDKP